MATTASMRPQAEGVAATDARASAGPQCQGDHYRAWIRPERCGRYDGEALCGWASATGLVTSTSTGTSTGTWVRWPRFTCDEEQPHNSPGDDHAPPRWRP